MLRSPVPPEAELSSLRWQLPRYTWGVAIQLEANIVCCFSLHTSTPDTAQHVRDHRLHSPIRSNRRYLLLGILFALYGFLACLRSERVCWCGAPTSRTKLGPSPRGTDSRALQVVWLRAYAASGATGTAQEVLDYKHSAASTEDDECVQQQHERHTGNMDLSLSHNTTILIFIPQGECLLEHCMPSAPLVLIPPRVPQARGV